MSSPEAELCEVAAAARAVPSKWFPTPQKPATVWHTSPQKAAGLNTQLNILGRGRASRVSHSRMQISCGASGAFFLAVTTSVAARRTLSHEAEMYLEEIQNKRFSYYRAWVPLLPRVGSTVTKWL